MFVTAYDQYTVAAFDEGAVDYLMKPLTPGRLAAACERVKARLSSAPSNLDGLLDALARRAAQKSPYLRWINASLGTDVKLITIDEVCYFQSDTKYTRVVTGDSESLIRSRSRSFRTSSTRHSSGRSIVPRCVNVNTIAGVSRELSGRFIVKLKNRNETLPVSQQFAHRFRQM